MAEQGEPITQGQLAEQRGPEDYRDPYQDGAGEEAE